MYSATKGALSAMMQNMSIELASKGIRVNAVLPGMTETPLIHNDDITQEQLNKDMELYPLKRYADPREIAWAIIYYVRCKYIYYRCQPCCRWRFYDFIGYGDTEIYGCGNSFGLSLCSQKDCTKFGVGLSDPPRGFG